MMKYGLKREVPIKRIITIIILSIVVILYSFNALVEANTLSLKHLEDNDDHAVTLLITNRFSAESNNLNQDFETINSDNEIIKRDTLIILIGCVGILFLLALIFVLINSRKTLRRAKAEADNINQLRQAFINADDSLVYLKDENLKYVFVNRAFETYFQLRAEDIIGRDDFSLKDDGFSKKRRESDLAVLEKETLITGEEEWEGRVYRTVKFPVRMMNGRVGVGAYKIDITDEREKSKKLQRMMYRHKILVDVLTMSFHDIQEQLDYVLHQSLLLTDSQYGYIYLYDEESREFTLNSWTNGVMQDCAVTDRQTKYQLVKTGIWGEVVRQRKPIVVNDFMQTNPLKKGYPEGHVQLHRFMSIPVIFDEKIVAVVGLANNARG